MSTQSYIEGWKKAKEQTSAVPNNISFGECKALAQDTYLATMEASLMSIAMKSGISFETWKRGIDAVIPKKMSSPRVDSIDRKKTVRVADTTSPKSTSEIALEESTAQMLHPTLQNQCSATTVGNMVLNTQSPHQI
jgi:hypothetical protein